MHHKIERYARNEIKAGLSLCTETQKSLFKRMYSYKQLDREINSVVDAVAADKLDNALDQVERTIIKNAGKSAAQPGQSDE